MRLLNEELKRSIIEKAIDEFYKNGFEKASLRKIVKSAGTTIGNFYNYFKSKEELYYTITDPIYNNLMYYMKNHSDNEMIKFDLPITFEQSRVYVQEALLGFISYEKHFVLLLTASKGTKYEKVWDNMIDVFSEHLSEHMEMSKYFKDVKDNSLLMKSLAHGFLEGALYVARSDSSLEEKLENLTNFCMVYFIGMLDIFKE